jgi:predicted Zn-dependent protease with MMP-like domain
MVERTKSESFDELVEWAYSTLPREIRVLRDFPGIQVLDEPPEAVTRRKGPGKETLGLFSGIYRTQQRHDDVRLAPNSIFVFRGPIQRCSRGNLRAEVKEVVWHEVAHWLGHNEHEVEQLGLSSLSLPADDGTPCKPESIAPKPDPETTSLQVPDDELQEESLRCVKCYSADVIRREVDKSVTSPGAWLREPVRIRMNVCTCRSCGHEWDDDDNG